MLICQTRLVRSALMSAVAVVLLATPASAEDFSGAYRIVSAGGDMRFGIRQLADGTVSGMLALPDGTTFRVHGSLQTDEDGDVSVVGTLVGPNGGGEFEFFPDDEDFSLLITPYDAVGTPRTDLAAIYYATYSGKFEGSESQTNDNDGGGESGVTDGARDPRLIGVWSTQVIMNTPGGGVATQLLMEIRPDGVLVDRGSRSMGSMPGVDIDSGLQGGGEQAMWRTAGNTLQVSYQGSAWVSLAQFQVTGDQLLLQYYDGDRKLWYRR